MSFTSNSPYPKDSPNTSNLDDSGKPKRSFQNLYPRTSVSAYSVAPSSSLFSKPNSKSRYPYRNYPPFIRMVLSSRVIRLAIALAVAIVICIAIFSATFVSSSTKIITENATPATHLSDSPGTANQENDSFECAKSFDGIKPINQYVIMIDAGSSGSRIHVYHFNNCLSSPRLVSEKFEMLNPGLSSYKSDPQAAAKSLDPLLKIALEAVPVESRACTPIAVKATAGLRLIGQEASDQILAAVRAHLENDYPFAVVSKENQGVAIMPGADEGVYAWVTVNYLLGNIVSDPKHKMALDKRPSTAAVFDLGGGSTQIVFEPRFPISTQNLPKGDHRYDLTFGANKYTLYQHSHLGYGLNVARDSMYASIVSTYLKAGKDIQTTTVVNPCLPPNTNLTDVKVKIDDQSYDVPLMIGPKQSSMLQCQKVAETLLKKEAECLVEPCSFNGIYQPSLVTNFGRDSDLYVISYFYDRTFPLGMPQSFNIDDLKDLAQKVCRGQESYPSFESMPGAVDQLTENPQWCGDLSYMLAVLHHGYDIPVHREVTIAKKVKGNELGWCLGASLPLLDSATSGWTCKVKQQN